MNKPLKLIYLVGRYPELTTTFIEREIKTLQQLGEIEIQPVSIRYPLSSTVSADHQKIRENTIYLIPKNWSDFNWFAFIIGNLFFIFQHPWIYFSTLFYLITHPHPNFKARLMTILHFCQGVYAAYLLRKRDFDHLHAHFIDRAVVVALIVGRLLNKSYSLTAHANSIFVKRILIREKVINAKFMVTVSEHNKAHLLNTYQGLDPDKIHVIHPWVDISHFVPPTSRSNSERFHILSVGRLVEKKGFGYLIDACNLLQKQDIDFECHIVGTGPLKVELEQKIAQYGLEDRVQLLGGQPQSEVLRLLGSWAQVFVLACVIARDGDRDGIPVSLAEAMAMELPVISTDIVGISELVQPEAGLLVPPHDPAALAEALKIIQNKSAPAQAEMGRQGRMIVDAEFNLLKGTKQLADLFRTEII